MKQLEALSNEQLETIRNQSPQFSKIIDDIIMSRVNNDELERDRVAIPSLSNNEAAGAAMLGAGSLKDWDKIKDKVKKSEEFLAKNAGKFYDPTKQIDEPLTELSDDSDVFNREQEKNIKKANKELNKYDAKQAELARKQEEELIKTNKIKKEAALKEKERADDLKRTKERFEKKEKIKAINKEKSAISRLDNQINEGVSKLIEEDKIKKAALDAAKNAEIDKQVSLNIDDDISRLPIDGNQINKPPSYLDSLKNRLSTYAGDNKYLQGLKSKLDDVGVAAQKVLPSAKTVGRVSKLAGKAFVPLEVADYFANATEPGIVETQGLTGDAGAYGNIPFAQGRSSGTTDLSMFDPKAVYAASQNMKINSSVPTEAMIPYAPNDGVTEEEYNKQQDIKLASTSPAPTQQKVAPSEQDSSMVEQLLKQQEIKNAGLEEVVRNRNINYALADMAQGLQNIGATMGSRYSSKDIPALQVKDELIKRADQQVQDYKDILEDKNQNDPKSLASQMARDILTKRGIKVPENATFAQLAAIAPYVKLEIESQIAKERVKAEALQNEARLAETRENRELRKEAALDRKDQQFINNVTKLQTDYGKDVKEVRDRLDALNELDGRLSSQPNNPLAIASAATFIARNIGQEKGPLSDTDIAAYKGSAKLTRIIERFKDEKFTTGTKMTNADIADAKELIRYTKEAAENVIKNRTVRMAEIGAQRLGTTPDVIEPYLTGKPAKYTANLNKETPVQQSSTQQPKQSLYEYTNEKTSTGERVFINKATGKKMLESDLKSRGLLNE